MAEQLHRLNQPKKCAVCGREIKPEPGGLAGGITCKGYLCPQCWKKYVHNLLGHYEQVISKGVIEPEPY